MSNSLMTDQNLDTIKMPEFWRWLFRIFQDQYDIPDFGDRAITIRNVFNPFNDKGESDLTLVLDGMKCFDYDNNYGLVDFFIAMFVRNNHEDENEQEAKDRAAYHFMMQVESYQHDCEKKHEQAAYFFDSDNYHWYRNIRGEKRMILNFHVEFISIIKVFRPDENVWERVFEVRIMYMLDNRKRVSSIFRLEPEDTLTTNAFAKAIWKHEFRQQFFKSDSECQGFFTHLNEIQKPRTITQYDRFGFITHHEKRYYLAVNALVCLPDTLAEDLVIIAPDEFDSFDIDGEEFLALPPAMKAEAPRLQMGPIDKATNTYMEDMEIINDMRSGDGLQLIEDQVRERICQMIAGNSEKHYFEGYLIYYYVMSYHFLDDIKDAFNHVLFLYLYGRANTGKGRMANVIMGFFGIKANDRLVMPTIRALENHMESHSGIPSWMDEFEPDLGNGKARIADQLFNSWFEHSNRPTSSGADRRKNEIKNVRSMIMFCSNFLPVMDHLSSRTLRVEYETHKRGREEHAFWLSDHVRETQHIFLAYSTNAQLNRNRYRKLLYEYKMRIKKKTTDIMEVKKHDTGITFEIHDRQINQLAAILSTYTIMTNLVHLKYVEDMLPADYKMSGEKMTDVLFNHDFFDWCVEYLIDNASETSEKDKLSQFLQTINYLVGTNEINNGYYNWKPNGNLQIWWNGLWGAYEKHQSFNAMAKEEVKSKLSNLAVRKDQVAQNWKVSKDSRVSRKGWEIKDAVKDQRFAYAFSAPHLTLPTYGSELGNDEDENTSGSIFGNQNQ